MAQKAIIPFIAAGGESDVYLARVIVTRIIHDQLSFCPYCWAKAKLGE
jgi:hypothetical protein